MGATVFRRRINYAIVGCVFGLVIPTIFFIGHISLFGYYVDNIYPFLKVAIPLTALLGLVFFVLSGIKKGIIRVVSLIISVLLVPWIYYLFWI